MTPDGDTVLTIAQALLDSAAMNDPAIGKDFMKPGSVPPRFEKAIAPGRHELVLAGARIVERLGPWGTEPTNGYGVAMLRLSDALDRIGFDPI